MQSHNNQQQKEHNVPNTSIILLTDYSLKNQPGIERV